MAEKTGRFALGVAAIIIVVSLIAVIDVFKMTFMRNDFAFDGRAVGAMRTISFGAIGYQAAYGKYPTSLEELGAGEQPFIDSALASGEKQGYKFEFVLVDEDSFTATAIPTDRDFGVKSYFLDETGVIRFSGIAGEIATSASPPVN